MKRRRKLKQYKVNRGSFEEQQLREDKKAETQRALLVILPVLMIAVLIVGIFFGYKYYEKSEKGRNIVSESSAVPAEQETVDPMLLTAVTPSSPLTADDVPALAEFMGVQVSPDMIDSLSEMLKAAEKNGVELQVVEGYISFEEQKERYDAAVKKYQKEEKSSLVMAESQVKRTIPREGECEQQTGLIIKLDDGEDGKFKDSGAYRWLKRNAADYGFIQRYPQKENVGGLSFSSQLFRYVGVDHAHNMRVYNMTFDEYAQYTAYQ